MKENGLQCLNQKKQKQCLKVERWLTMKGRSTKWIIKLRRLKLVQHYSINHCQNEKFSKTVTFLVYELLCYINFAKFCF